VSTFASVPDLLRLLAVPVFGWAAWRDVRTRRVPNRTWVPLVALGALALAIEGWLVYTGETPVPVDQGVYLVRVVISLGFVGPLAYAFWWFGGFGGADAKALITAAVLFPTFPTYLFPGFALPVVVPTLGVFAMSVLSNTVVIGIAYPFVLTLRNAVGGHVSKVMFFGRPVRATAVTEEYGRLLETTDGFTRGGLDIDALRMYLSWRGAALADLRGDPERFRDPASIPAETNPPGDGSMPVTDGGREASPEPTATGDEAGSGEETLADPWGAERFFDELDGGAYGTTPEQLRAGLDVLVAEDEVWITPGIPFLVPMFVGLLVALTYGDLLFAAIDALGFA
jgi:preflagellin peptidase FlaK